MIAQEVKKRKKRKRNNSAFTMWLNTTDQDVLMTLLIVIQTKHKLLLSNFIPTQKICKVGFSIKMSK